MSSFVSIIHPRSIERLKNLNWIDLFIVTSSGCIVPKENRGPSCPLNVQEIRCVEYSELLENLRIMKKGMGEYPFCWLFCKNGRCKARRKILGLG